MRAILNKDISTVHIILVSVPLHNRGDSGLAKYLVCTPQSLTYDTTNELHHQIKCGIPQHIEYKVGCPSDIDTLPSHEVHYPQDDKYHKTRYAPMRPIKTLT